MFIIRVLIYICVCIYIGGCYELAVGVGGSLGGDLGSKIDNAIKKKNGYYNKPTKEQSPEEKKKWQDYADKSQAKTCLQYIKSPEPWQKKEKWNLICDKYKDVK